MTYRNVITSRGASEDASIEGMLGHIKLRNLYKKPIQNFCFFATVLILSVFLGARQLSSRRKELKRLSNCGWKVFHECSEGSTTVKSNLAGKAVLFFRKLLLGQW